MNSGIRMNSAIILGLSLQIKFTIYTEIGNEGNKSN